MCAFFRDFVVKYTTGNNRIQCCTTDYGWNRPDGIVVVKGTGTLTLTNVQSYGSVFIGDSTRVFLRNFEIHERISVYDSDQDNLFQDGVLVGGGIGFDACNDGLVDYPIKIWPDQHVQKY